MIDIVYDRGKHKLTVKGHAKSAPKGEDLVCAGVSALVYTLAANVTHLCEDKSHCRRPVIKLNDGDATIACSPVHGMKALTTLTFNTVCVGFELLAAEYPDFVRYSVKG